MLDLFWGASRKRAPDLGYHSAFSSGEILRKERLTTFQTKAKRPVSWQNTLHHHVSIFQFGFPNPLAIRNPPLGVHRITCIYMRIRYTTDIGACSNREFVLYCTCTTPLSRIEANRPYQYGQRSFVTLAIYICRLAVLPTLRYSVIKVRGISNNNTSPGTNLQRPIFQ